MNTFACDANLLIALLDPDNATHEDSLDLLSEIPADAPILVHPLNLAEVLSFYASATEREARWAALRRAARFAAADMDVPALEQAMSLSGIRHSSNAKMPDVCALYVATRTDATLLTFDKRLANAAHRIGLRTLPDRSPVVESPGAPSDVKDAPPSQL